MTIFWFTSDYMDGHCGNTINLGSPHRTHLRLTGSSTYASDMNCEVTITSDWTRMTFEFVNFYVETPYDFLEIHDGGDRHGVNLTGMRLFRTYNI